MGTVWDFCRARVVEQRGGLLWLAGAACLGAGLTVSLPWALRGMVNAGWAFHQGTAACKALVNQGVGYVLVDLGLALTFRFREAVLLHLLPSLKHAVSRACMAKLQHQGHAFVQQHPSGQVAQHVSDVEQGAVAMVLAVEQVFTQTLVLGLGCWLLMTVHPSLGGVFLAGSLGLVLLGAWRCDALKGQASLLALEGGRVAAQRLDSLNHLLMLRLWRAQGRELAWLDQGLERRAFQDRVLQRATLGLRSLQDLVVTAMQASLVVVLVVGYQQGWVSLGDVALVCPLSQVVVGGWWNVANTLPQWLRSWGVCCQALGSLTSSNDVQSSPSSVVLKEAPEVLTLDQVGWVTLDAVNADPRHVLQEVSWEVRRGETWGVVGPSGAGKTSLLHVLVRWMDPTQGKVLVDGVALNQVDLASWYQHVVYLPQHTALLNRSVLDNLRMVRPNATEDDVVKAAQRAALHDRVLRLPDGYHTLVGDGGVALSGGECQRLALARAWLQGGAFWLLDEATSALDDGTETSVIEPLLSGEHALVMVTHRAHRWVTMDRLLYMEAGRVVEVGDHESLLRLGGRYATMWERGQQEVRQ